MRAPIGQNPRFITVQKTVLRKYSRWLIKNRVSIKQSAYELEISIAWRVDEDAARVNYHA